MCGRYVRRSDKQHIAEHYRLRHVSCMNAFSQAGRSKTVDMNGCTVP
jgi:hypothetical protein